MSKPITSAPLASDFQMRMCITINLIFRKSFSVYRFRLSARVGFTCPERESVIRLACLFWQSKQVARWRIREWIRGGATSAGKFRRGNVALIRRHRLAIISWLIEFRMTVVRVYSRESSSEVNSRHRLIDPRHVFIVRLSWRNWGKIVRNYSIINVTTIAQIVLHCQRRN